MRLFLFNLLASFCALSVAAADEPSMFSMVTAAILYQTSSVRANAVKGIVAHGAREAFG